MYYSNLQFHSDGWRDAHVFAHLYSRPVLPLTVNALDWVGSWQCKMTSLSTSTNIPVPPLACSWQPHPERQRQETWDSSLCPHPTSYQLRTSGAAGSAKRPSRLQNAQYSSGYRARMGPPCLAPGRGRRCRSSAAGRWRRRTAWRGGRSALCLCACQCATTATACPPAPGSETVRVG
jgi:hypothetical protein